MPPKATCHPKPDRQTVRKADVIQRPDSLPETLGERALLGWRVLDTDFDDGQAFFKAWQAWRSEPARPLVLHYVAFCQQPVAPDTLIDRCGRDAALTPLACRLAEQWFGLMPGFHRFLLDQGHVVLTLCVGDVLPVLRQQQFLADVINLSWRPGSGRMADDTWSLWAVKALSRCCKRGTLINVDVATTQHLPGLRSYLQQCGFSMTPIDHGHQSGTSSPITARFDPLWTLKNTRQAGLSAPMPVQRCAVIGAGLAGASVAASLARRGWQVHVLDQAANPASGASGLPVGLVVPHVSSDDCALSRLSRAGVRLMLQQAKVHLSEGQQWAPSGVLEQQIGGTPQLPASWPAAGKAWSLPSSDQIDVNMIGPGLWHPPGAWIRPAELVSAWLRQPGVTFQGHAKVAGLRQHEGVWDLLDANGQVLYSAERVVFANAGGAWPLLQALARNSPLHAEALGRLPAMQGMRGLLSWALHADTPASSPLFPQFPVNGSGSVIPQISTPNGPAWFVGSSYQPEQQPERSDHDNHARNLASLQKMMPTLATALAPVFANGAQFTWKNTRCVTSDRLPVVGALEQCKQPSLWICAGLGSRGLSFSVLCAELLAAQWGAEPLPIEAHLAKSLFALRG